MELLVVLAIIATLAALLLPALAAAKQAGRKAVCMSNLRQVGIAIQGYAGENGGLIPYGPKAPPFTSPSSFYPSTGAPTSLLSLQSGAPVGLGLLLDQQLAAQVKVLFCPGTDQPVDADAELAKVGHYQAQGSYYYRHGGNTLLFDSPASTNVPAHLKLDSLGLNRNGQPIRALAIDSEFLCPPQPRGVQRQAPHASPAAFRGHPLCGWQCGFAAERGRPVHGGLAQLRRLVRRVQPDPHGSRKGRCGTLMSP